MTDATTTDWSNQLEAIADLMLGVAYADGTFDRSEAAAIRDGLAVFDRIRGLSTVVQERVQTFSPTTFDLTAATAAIRFNGLSDKRVLLELVRDVLDADNIRDHRETSYFFAVAQALNLSEDAERILDAPPAAPPLRRRTRLEQYD